jgi:aspartyl-tRNA(Asn)/glutamyl-tRNA(Gln) amidotransferase subunit A
MPLSQLNRMTAGALARDIAGRKVSPLEAVEAALARIGETEPELNAFVQVDAEGALAAARRAEGDVMAGKPLGPLHGVPVSIKDLIDVEGLRTTYGSLTLEDNVARADAPSVARLRAAGAIILGKTTTSEFGYRGYTRSLLHGNTRNPWNLGRTPGGSSGGAVASVAAGVTAIALGTDGGGSVRAPCSLTGLVGIKANYARIPVWPGSATSTLAHVGPIARTVDDAGLILSVCAGADLRDPFSLLQPIGEPPSAADLSGLRVAFSPTLGYGRVDAPLAAAVSEAVGKLGPVFPDIELVEQVCSDEGAVLAAEFMGGCSARLGDIVDSTPDLIDPPLLAAIRAFRAMNTDRFTRLLWRRQQLRENMRQFFERYDLLITPTLPCTAWDIERGAPPGHEDASAWSYFTYPFNLTGQPAGSLPCGLSADGLPIGLQLVVPVCGEARLLAAMRAAEAALGPVCPVPIEPQGADAQVQRG